MLKRKMTMGTFFKTSSHTHSPNSTTRFWWQEGQKCRRLQEKARRYSLPHSAHRTRAKPFFKFTEYALLWFTFLAAAWLLREGGHISIDTVISRLPTKTRRY